MRLEQQAYIAAWYTSSTVSHKAKVAIHRSTVAKTRTQKGKK